MEKIFSTTLAGRPLTFETGKLAQLASGAVLVRYGDTAVMATATMSAKPREGIDFFPLSVDYEEKLYAVGKIPGGFIRREGKPSEKAVLASRVIDRPIRPLFPSDLRNDVTVITTVMSVEQDNSPEVAAMIGASAAICISDIPFAGPIAGVQVGLVDGELIINPTLEQREKSTLQLTVAGTAEKVNMIEAGAHEVPEDVMLKAILMAHEEIKKICAFIKEVAAQIGKPKREYQHIVVPETLFEEIREEYTEKVKAALDTNDKTERDARLKPVYEEVYAAYAESDVTPEEIDAVMYKLQKYIVRRWILDEGRRVDGRGLKDIRPLAAEVSLLPRVHGSGLFTRGQTQVMSVVTLGAMGDQQMLDGIDTEEYKRYMHHYNFPSYSVGETRPSRGPGRREIGHGALAERALEPVIPTEEEFPYAIRVVSEVLSSNGSTSQGSVCGSTLALMDAGVPIKAPVAGISCGLVTEGNRFITMTDIQGLEDFFGDMDFKVAGTKNGITAIQVDIKIDGLTPEIIETALMQTREARIKILDEIMLPCIGEARPQLSPYAPKIMTMSIDVDKIREVIGTGGKVIQKIIAETGVKIDIEDDGRVYIATVDQEAGEKAMRIIKGIVSDVEPGQEFTGKVVRIMNFGAFVEFLPGKDGLIHISKLDRKRVEKVEDVVQIGDTVDVRVIEIDKMGRINLQRIVPKEEN
ncbi:MAG: polyribonucleotide nucleotidyltransferase [Clostridia bacterium]|nr:polyribonucleotide nucleotidyltransferase [Oscillospiraceae bacterium]MBQ7032551.1 polyribonucleotide nucleotidyltransferase [Clostridia bacterium]